MIPDEPLRVLSGLSEERPGMPGPIRFSGRKRFRLLELFDRLSGLRLPPLGEHAAVAPLARLADILEAEKHDLFPRFGKGFQNAVNLTHPVFFELPEVEPVRLLAFMDAPPVVIRPPELLPVVVMVESAMLMVVPDP